VSMGSDFKDHFKQRDAENVLRTHRLMKYLFKVAGPSSEGWRCTGVVSFVTSGQVRTSVSAADTWRLLSCAGAEGTKPLLTNTKLFEKCQAR
jgi:hypothetical protein